MYVLISIGQVVGLTIGGSVAMMSPIVLWCCWADWAQHRDGSPHSWCDCRGCERRRNPSPEHIAQMEQELGIGV
jgi:hypothetical protein